MPQDVVADRLFTVECRRIFDRAGELGHPAVCTEHLLLAMLDVPSFGAGRLAHAGADAERVRTEVAARTHYMADDEALRRLGIDASLVLERLGQGQPSDLPWTDLALQVLIDAYDAAIADAERRELPSELRIAGTDWLFLALLERNEGIGAEVIASLGIDRIDIQGQILQWMPIIQRFRKRMLSNDTHGRYRSLLAAWDRAGLDQQDETRATVRSLHRAHDRLIEGAVELLQREHPDEESIAAEYFRDLARPVEDATLALAACGIAPG
jgi:Clp amino terminal domain, pathogenicity island component